MGEIVESLSFKRKMLEVNFLGKRNIKKKNWKVNVMKKESNHEKDNSNQEDLTVEQGKPNELSDQQKEELQVKDGQNDHHVDERGGN
ncbi:hypothetical protein [Psychrobacillus sp. FSL H8-0510]|uniref:hypothetical protein n=1 Tax=Psychrobacillus sp. FSL H8-0510 TaxID=2921394 RepID=UPI0030FA7346